MEVALVIRRLLVNRHDNRLTARFLRHVEHLPVPLEIASRIALEPERPLGGFGDSWERKARDVAHDHGRRRVRCRVVHPQLAIGMQVPLTRRRSEHDRTVHPDPEQLGRCVDLRGSDTPTPDQLDPVKRIPISVQRELGIGAVRGVVVNGERHVVVEHRFEIERGAHLVEAEDPSMRAERVRVALRVQQGRRRQKRGQTAQRLSARESPTPLLFDVSHRTSYSRNTWCHILPRVARLTASCQPGSPRRGRTPARHPCGRGACRSGRRRPGPLPWPAGS